MRDELRLLRDADGAPLEIVGYCADITDSKVAEAALRESEERSVLVIAASNDGIYDWNPITGASFLSPRLKEILGYRDDELPNEFLTFHDRVHPEDQAVIDATISRVHSSPEKASIADRMRMRHRDGSYRWVSSRGRALRDEAGEVVRIIGVLTDVNERAQASEQLAANEKRLREILDSLFGFVCIVTLDGILIDVNRAALEATGVSAQQVLGQPIWEAPCWAGGEAAASRLRHSVARASSGEVIRDEAQVFAQSGELNVMDVTFGPVRNSEGEICNVVGFGVDITRRKQMEEELRTAKLDADASSRVKSEFLANMSHEIRTPMNGILGLTEVVLDSDINDEQREYLSMVKTSAESLTVILGDILEMAKIQAGQFVPQPQEFWLRDLLGSIVKAHEPAAAEKSLRFTCEVDPVLPDVLVGDSGCLRKILLNMLGNAIKFTAAGEVAMKVAGVPGIPGMLHFQVRDTGIGVSLDKQQEIFEPFSQIDGSSRRKFGGTGLGLAISAQLAGKMGGRIWVASDGVCGSTFHFTVRLNAVPTSLEGAAALGRERRAEPRFAVNDLAVMKTRQPISPVAHNVRVLDTSTQGLKLQANEALDPGTVVQIHLHGSFTMGEIRYCVRIGSGFQLGVKIQNVAR